MKKALITGITGQDGSYLADLLLLKGYEVHGVIRRSSSFNTNRLEHIYQDPHEANRCLHLHYGDLGDMNIAQLVAEIEPDEVYNLGAQSHVRVSFDVPEYTVNVTGVGALRILEAIRKLQEKTRMQVKYYQASSSEMFGSTPPPQNEKTAFHPRSPYGCAKVLAYHTTVHYREAYDIFACNGILFNHESERRGKTFVTRKVCRAAAKIAAGQQDKLYLGNLEARRDWGYAPEYVEAMHAMLQHHEADDFVIGTGTSHSVRDLVKAAFGHVGIQNWEDYIGIDPRYYRPTEVDHLVADGAKAKEKLGWEPKTTFEEMIQKMVTHEVEDLKQNKEV